MTWWGMLYTHMSHALLVYRFNMAIISEKRMVELKLKECYELTQRKTELFETVSISE